MGNEFTLDCGAGRADMFDTLDQREEYVDNILELLQGRFDLSDTQIFVFGSFLTSDYVPGKSDIDIGVYSECESKMYDIRYELENFLGEAGLRCDIVIMHLSDKLKINIPIMIYGRQLTPYESEGMVDYLVRMVRRYGYVEQGPGVNVYV